MHRDRPPAQAQRVFQALGTCERGGVALLLGLALPVLVLSVGAAVEYGSLISRRAALQAAADGAALTAARELTLAAVDVRGPRLPDCPAIPNPMADRDPPPVDPLCRATDKRVEANATLQPGTYCKGLFIGADARVTFSPGVYVIKDGVLRIDSNADVWGRNVGFHFVGNEARFEFTSNAGVNLGAPKDGPMAGILFYGDPNGTTEREFKITSNYANTLVGTIYLPKDRFVVDSSQPVADQSAWTAIVVKRMTLLAQPHLVLNTNYSQTDVPVPQGFSGSSDVRLSR